MPVSNTATGQADLGALVDRIVEVTQLYEAQVALGTPLEVEAAKSAGYAARDAFDDAHAALLAELRATKERERALVAALDEAISLVRSDYDFSTGPDERGVRWHALAHPTEGDPAP